MGWLDDGFLSDAGVAASNAGGVGSAPYAGYCSRWSRRRARLDQKASDAVTGLLNGSGIEVHDAMIASQKASMAF